MPYLSIQTNITLDAAMCNDFIQKISKNIANLLGKPESYVMVAIVPTISMIFAGNQAATAFLELKSLGLPEKQTKEFSKALCAMIADTLAIEPGRIYIQFSNPDRHMWGWDNSTF